MWGNPKCRASARAIVPLPLAAGPSTATTRAFFGLLDLRSSANRRALTGPYRYGKARPRTPGEAPRGNYSTGVETQDGEARMGQQAHLPQVLDPLLRPRQGQSGALHRMRHRLHSGAGAEIEAADGVRARCRPGQGAGAG